MHGNLYNIFIISFVHLYGAVRHVGDHMTTFCELFPRSAVESLEERRHLFGLLYLRSVTARYSPFFG